jgi:hypothetical protein
MFENLDELRFEVLAWLESLRPELIASLTGWDYIFDALYVAGIF